MSKRSPPQEIPETLSADRATRRLITVWLHHQQRYAICCRRIYWKTPEARAIEKKRRREKWRKLAQILDIERTLILWCAKATHHPEIYTPKSIDKPESQVRTLERRYYENRRVAHHTVGPERKRLLQERTAIVAEKRAIERAWLVLLITAVDPEILIPSPIKLHPRELLPRKLARASKELLAELT